MRRKEKKCVECGGKYKSSPQNIKRQRFCGQKCKRSYASRKRFLNYPNLRGRFRGNRATNIFLWSQARGDEDVTAPCHYCGKRLTPDRVTIDHKKPVTKLTKEEFKDITNQVICCRSCNQEKGTLPYEFYMEYKEMRPQINGVSGMNKTETRYSEYLSLLHAVPLGTTSRRGISGDESLRKRMINQAKTKKEPTEEVHEHIISWKFEPMGLKLASEKCYYYPDFLVVYPDRFEFHEVKAYNKKEGKPLIKDDALVKIKVAASEFPWIIFKVVWENGHNNWNYRLIKGGV